MRIADRKNISIVAVTAIFGMAVLPAMAFAATDTKSTTVTATLGSTISMTVTGSVALAVTPVTGGSQTSASDTVTVATNNSSGYTLTLADDDANTSLVNGGSSISAHAGTLAAPTALANNSWGYRVDNTGGFGTGGAIETNVTSSAIKYAGVPASGSPETIKTTSSTSSGDTTTVWYAVKADTTNPNGAYADTVSYTATTRP